jgi:hypothetical protein
LPLRKTTKLPVELAPAPTFHQPHPEKYPPEPEISPVFMRLSAPIVQSAQRFQQAFQPNPAGRCVNTTGIPQENASKFTNSGRVYPILDVFLDIHNYKV